ncbi:MAG TPA: nucleotidyltransferase domain-containing protein [Actinomycetota bacterium]|nr:nucleotidyltransferase domain-containing protein [Actinomycetota bacterium]
MAEIVARRKEERERLIGVARSYVEALAETIPVLAAAVVGSVARGDFNVWSDIDVVVVCDDLPERTPERMAVLVREHTEGVQPVGFTREEFRRAFRKRNPLATSVTTEGVILLGENFFRGVGADG